MRFIETIHCKLSANNGNMPISMPAVHNCKNIRLRVKTGEWNTIISTPEQFSTAK